MLWAEVPPLLTALAPLALVSHLGSHNLVLLKISFQCGFEASRATIGSSTYGRSFADPFSRTRRVSQGPVARPLRMHRW